MDKSTRTPARCRDVFDHITRTVADAHRFRRRASQWLRKGDAAWQRGDAEHASQCWRYAGEYYLDAHRYYEAFSEIVELGRRYQAEVRERVAS